MKARSDMITVFVARPDETGESYEFLQMLRAANDYMGGTWQIIRGGVEPGENSSAAALREMREEAGLTPKKFYRLGSVESFYTPNDDTLWHAVAFFGIVDREQEVKLNEEHEAFRWLSREQFEANIMWASERHLLADLFHDILENGPGKPYLVIELN